MQEQRYEENGQADSSDLPEPWFAQMPGSLLIAQEQATTAGILSRLFGFHILQLSMPGTRNFLANSSISHKISMQFGSTASTESCTLLGDEENLAFASDSVDVVVLPHVIEFVDNPHRLLREIERILIGEGHLVISCLNPWSWWGLWRLLLFWREEPPWHGHFYGLSRVKDWLSLLDFELLEYHRLFYRPPFKKAGLMRRLLFLEKLGKVCWPFVCSNYVILAKKRVVSLTPIKMRWHARRQLIASGVVEPGA